MPELVITKVDVATIKGRVEFVRDQHADVTVYISEDGKSVTAEVDLPGGNVVEVDVPMAATADARDLLVGAVREAVNQEG